MPWSANTYDDLLSQHIRQLNPATILDIGAGAGKNGTIARNSGYSKQLDCIEPTDAYISNFKLDTIYDKIYRMDLLRFIETEYKFQYDLAIFGDILEHTFRSQVIDYLDYFLYKCKWVIVIWPTNYPQDNWGENPYEIHRSNFKLHDLVEKFDVNFYNKKFLMSYNENPNYSPIHMNYVVLKGYITINSDSI